MEHAHHMAIPMFARVHQVSQELTVSVSTPAFLWRAHKTFFAIDFMGRYIRVSDVLIVPARQIYTNFLQFEATVTLTG